MLEDPSVPPRQREGKICFHYRGGERKKLLRTSTPGRKAEILLSKGMRKLHARFGRKNGPIGKGAREKEKGGSRSFQEEGKGGTLFSWGENSEGGGKARKSIFLWRRSQNKRGGVLKKTLTSFPRGGGREGALLYCARKKEKKENQDTLFLGGEKEEAVFSKKRRGEGEKKNESLLSLRGKKGKRTSADHLAERM